MIRSNIRRRKSQKSQTQGAPSSGGSFGGGGGAISLPDLTTLQYVPYNIEDDVNWLVPDRKVKSNLGFIGNLEGKADEAKTADNANLLKGRADYYNPGNSNSFLYSWMADGMFANDVIARNIRGKEGVAGSTNDGDLFIQYLSSFNTLINVDGIGKCGVGTNNPTDKFHVIGNVRASGDFIGRGALLSGNLSCQNINASGNIVAKDGQLDNLKVLGNLDVYELTANQTRVTNGDLWIQDSAIIESINVVDNLIKLKEQVMKNGDLIIAQVKRVSGSVIRYAGVVDRTWQDLIELTDITGNIELLQEGDLIVRVGNLTNPARQSSVLNCVSFGGYGAATLYYANVDAIPVGSFYPDNSKITSAIGDLRAIGYGSASVYSRDGEFSGTLNSNKGRIANFTLEHDKLKAKNIQLIDGNMPTLEELAGTAIADPSVVRQSSDVPYNNIVSVKRSLTTDKPMTLIMGYVDNQSAYISCSTSTKADVDSPAQPNTATVNLKSFNIKVFKVTAERGREEVFAYYDNTQLGDSGATKKSYFLPKLTITVSAGIYVIETTVSIEASPKDPVQLPLKPWIATGVNLNGYELRPLNAISYIADNGITSFFGYNDYLRHEASSDFTVRKGQYILKVSPTGIQKSINGGTTWQSI